MYTEEYESKGFPIRSFAIKLILNEYGKNLDMSIFSCDNNVV